MNGNHSMRRSLTLFFVSVRIIATLAYVVFISEYGIQLPLIVSFILFLLIVECVRNWQGIRRMILLLLLLDTGYILARLWQFSAFSGVASSYWNSLTREVMVQELVPLLVFWAAMSLSFLINEDGDEVMKSKE